MRKNWKILLTTTAVLTALGMGSALYAQSKPAAPQSGGSMMQGGHDMSGMMNMMGQMGQMMESCNEMMKNMNQAHAAGAPKQGQKPEQKR
jgi:protein CpxP